MPRTVRMKSTVEQELKNKGIQIAVTDSGGKHQANFYVTKTGIEYCEGKTRKGNGVSVSWDVLPSKIA